MYCWKYESAQGQRALNKCHRVINDDNFNDMNDCYFSLIKGGTSNTHKDNMYHNNENQGKVVKSIMYDKRADYIY